MKRNHNSGISPFWGNYPKMHSRNECHAPRPSRYGCGLAMTAGIRTAEDENEEREEKGVGDCVIEVKAWLLDLFDLDRG
jgi:hypothetical protein